MDIDKDSDNNEITSKSTEVKGGSLINITIDEDNISTEVDSRLENSKEIENVFNKKSPNNGGSEIVDSRPKILNKPTKITERQDKVSYPQSNNTGAKPMKIEIPGRSYIIGIRNYTGDGKKLLFDCVLCFDAKERPVSGPVFNKHIKSKEHALKVMEISNRSLFDKYRNNEEANTSEVVESILAYEETQKKPTLVSATKENHVAQRKLIASKISLFKERSLTVDSEKGCEENSLSIRLGKFEEPKITDNYNQSEQDNSQKLIENSSSKSKANIDILKLDTQTLQRKENEDCADNDDDARNSDDLSSIPQKQKSSSLTPRRSSRKIQPVNLPPSGNESSSSTARRGRRASKRLHDASTASDAKPDSSIGSDYTSKSDKIVNIDAHEGVNRSEDQNDNKNVIHKTEELNEDETCTSEDKNESEDVIHKAEEHKSENEKCSSEDHDGSKDVIHKAEKFIEDEKCTSEDQNEREGVIHKTDELNEGDIPNSEEEKDIEENVNMQNVNNFPKTGDIEAEEESDVGDGKLISQSEEMIENVIHDHQFLEIRVEDSNDFTNEYNEDEESSQVPDKHKDIGRSQVCHEIITDENCEEVKSLIEDKNINENESTAEAGLYNTKVHNELEVEIEKEDEEIMEVVASALTKSSVKSIQSPKISSTTTTSAQGKTEKPTETVKKQVKTKTVETSKAPQPKADKNFKPQASAASDQSKNKIPGRSYIIGIKNSTSDGKKTLFDCVLCFDGKDGPVPGPLINKHIKSKEHALKVMEISNRSLFDKYKNNDTAAASEVVNAILEYEETRKRHTLILANKETHKAQRELTVSKITLLRECGLALDTWKSIEADRESGGKTPSNSMTMEMDLKSKKSAEVLKSKVASEVASKAKEVSSASNKKAVNAAGKTRIAWAGNVSKPQSAVPITLSTSNFLQSSRNKPSSEPTVEMVEKDGQGPAKQSEQKKKDKGRLAQSIDERKCAAQESLSVQLALKQRDRRPSKIVLVMEARDVFLDPDKLGNNIKVLRRREVGFSQMFDIIKSDDWFDKGTMFVFLNGEYSCMRIRKHSTCSQFKCPNSVPVCHIEKDLQSSNLIDEALKLHKEILDNTTNDKAMFCETIPINIDANNVLKVDRRVCFSFHPIDFHKKVPAHLLDWYLTCIKEFNVFAKNYAAKLCLPFWDMVNRTFTDSIDDLETTFLHFKKDGISFNDTDSLRRSEAIFLLSEALLDLLGNKSTKTETKPETKKADAMPSRISEWKIRFLRCRNSYGHFL